MLDLVSPGVGDRAGMRAVRRQSPLLPTLRLQPAVERSQRGKVRRRLPEPVAGVLNVLLDLPLLPAGGRIAELGLEQEVADHGRETGVDLALFAAANLVDRRPHVVVNAAPRHAA